MPSLTIPLFTVSLLTLATAVQLPLSKPGLGVVPQKDTPWIRVFYTPVSAPVLYPRTSSSCLDVSGKIILTTTFEPPCSAFTSTDSPDKKASNIFNERLEPCGFMDGKVFGCRKGIEHGNFTYEGDYYVPMLSVDRTKGPYDQNFRSMENFTTVAKWVPDPIVIGTDGDSVTLWWGRY